MLVGEVRIDDASDMAGSIGGIGIGTAKSRSTLSVSISAVQIGADEPARYVWHHRIH
jgi:hypothetical protein